ncbi:nucleoside 2-deoxyribosyltransferase [Pleomorphomonas sp. PLEO]|uniref:nucleoside 2-deoxyribosyltransferase n=1 Tax=Pleomorphomonas sp. PLEO TaxID=3239306 RepID=UPI00351E567A
MSRPRAYLAGPEVFLSDSAAVIASKRELALSYGFQPNGIAEEELDPTGLSLFEFGRRISLANEKAMRGSDLIIANLTPFRGISADIGTAFEVGFMCALGRAAYGYTNTARPYFERLRDDYYHGAIAKTADGATRGPDGMMVEDHGMVDNLMLDGGIETLGGILVRRQVEPDNLWSDLSAFEDCLRAAAVRFGLARPT